MQLRFLFDVIKPTTSIGLTTNLNDNENILGEEIFITKLGQLQEAK
jgi:hypothetical protein